MNRGTNDKCFNCGKKGHFVKNCKTSRGVNPEYRNTKMCCFRCGRKSHYSTECYASTHITGYHLKNNSY